MTETDSADRYAHLTFRQLDFLCQGLGHACVHCGNHLPAGEEAPRVCPSISPETCHEVARAIRAGVR